MRSFAHRAIAPAVRAGRGPASAKRHGEVWWFIWKVFVTLVLAMLVAASWLTLRPSTKFRPGSASPSASASKGDAGVIADARRLAAIADVRRPAVVANAGPPTIIVDAGHGGQDEGARRNGLLEKNLTLDTALRLEAKLRLLGFPVVLTRRDDRYVELSERSDVANRYPHALFISIHFNDFAAASGQGVETFYASDKAMETEDGWFFVEVLHPGPEVPPADNGMTFARTVQTAVVKGLGVSNRGVKPAGYAVIRHSRCPAILIEGGFINNPAQAKEIGRPEYREKLAAAIATAIATYHRQCAETERARFLQAGQ